jgi:hypothetical protein
MSSYAASSYFILNALSYDSSQCAKWKPAIYGMMGMSTVVMHSAGSENTQLRLKVPTATGLFFRSLQYNHLPTEF